MNFPESRAAFPPPPHLLQFPALPCSSHAHPPSPSQGHGLHPLSFNNKMALLLPNAGGSSRGGGSDGATPAAAAAAAAASSSRPEEKSQRARLNSFLTFTRVLSWRTKNRISSDEAASLLMHSRSLQCSDRLMLRDSAELTRRQLRAFLVRTQKTHDDEGAAALHAAFARGLADPAQSVSVSVNAPDSGAGALHALLQPSPRHAEASRRPARLASVHPLKRWSLRDNVPLTPVHDAHCVADISADQLRCLNRTGTATPTSPLHRRKKVASFRKASVCGAERGGVPRRVGASGFCAGASDAGACGVPSAGRGQQRGRKRGGLEAELRQLSEVERRDRQRRTNTVIKSVADRLGLTGPAQKLLPPPPQAAGSGGSGGGYEAPSSRGHRGSVCLATDYAEMLRSRHRAGVASPEAVESTVAAAAASLPPAPSRAAPASAGGRRAYAMAAHPVGVLAKLECGGGGASDHQVGLYNGAGFPAVADFPRCAQACALHTRSGTPTVATVARWNPHASGKYAG